MLDASLKEQVRSIFSGLKADYTFDMEVAPQHESRGELVELASCSDRIACRERPGEGLRFSLLRNGEPTGISFRAVPTGHEFSSLLLAVLNADGQGKNFPDRSVCDRVRALNGPIHLTTYVSLTCTNCPDVVQALNAMATLNPGVEHETVDGAINQAEVAALNVQGVPSVFADGELLHVGRGDFGELLAKLEARYGIDAAGIEAVERRFDVVVLDGVFVQIGLSANSDLFDDLLERNRAGEIVIDDYCRTGIPGVYAAGDVSTVPYKQIVVAMGEGAKAALSAFDDRVRGVIG